MSTIAVGVFRTVRFKKQAGQGTIAAGGAATGEYARRVTCTLDLTKQQYKSNEIRPSMQRADSRHGVKAVAGSLSGELGAGVYQDFFESLLRQVVQTPATTGALTNVTAASTGAATGTFTRAAGSFLTDGFRQGDVVRWVGWSTTGVPNNAHNMIITTLTATVMTVLTLDGVNVGAKASGDSVTCTLAGKKTWIPATGHTRDYYTVEHFFADLVQSERYVDVVVSQATIRVPATGFVTVEFTLMGLDMQTGNAAYFTSPAAAVQGGLYAASGGALLVNGTKVGTLTGLEVTINGNFSAPGGVVGSNVDPDLFPGSIDVSGSATIFFDSVTYRDAFINETVCSLYMALVTGSAANADVCCITMSNLKFGGASKDDGEKGMVQTLPFIASENLNSSADVLSTIAIQDSLFT